MAKRRMIDTRFWSDNFIIDLNPLDRYLFLYFLTNEHTNICGIYELPLKRMSDETGIEKEMLSRMLKRLKGKVAYVNGWVAIKNFSKYQSDNESVRKGVVNAKKTIPSHILESVDRVWQGDHTLSPESEVFEPESEPELKLEPELKIAEINSADVVTVIDSFEEINPSYKKWYGNKTQRGAIKRLIETHTLDRILKVVKLLPSIKGKQYFPTITTPLQLEDKWASLEGAFIRLKNNGQTQRTIL